MPYAPKRPCRYPNCPELVDKGYCSTHNTAKNKWQNQRPADSPESKFYGSAAWKKTRLKALERDLYLCQVCKAKDILTAALDVHHIVPLAADLEQGLRLENLVSICRPCHRKIPDSQY